MFSSSIIKCRLKYSKITATKIIRSFVSKTRNLYETLGLTPHATQADIKAAYYKLSKAYHPDLNPNDAVASEKFRAISEAYEVLGTYRLRKLYDKGIIHRAGNEFSHHSKTSQKTQPYDIEDEIDDDDTTRFYKSRLRREHTGKSKIYDFDEWTKGHYGETFRKQQEVKKKESMKTMRNKKATTDKVQRTTMFLFIAIAGCFVVIADYLTSNIDLDIDKIGQKEKKINEK